VSWNRPRRPLSRRWSCAVREDPNHEGHSHPRVLLPALLGLALILPATARAAPPLHQRESGAFALTPAPGLTAACGYPINLFGSGFIDITTFFDASGNAVRLTVTFPDFKYTYVNPATSASIVSPSVSVAHVDLITGDVAVTGLTLHLHIPGANAVQQVGDVGRQVVDALGNLLASSGHFTDVVPQLCTLLAP
jgi:hypothetical protein